MVKSSTPRPYWHVDAKWICALLLILSLNVTLTLFSLWRLTSEKVAIPLATTVVATMFSSKGLDDASEIAELKRKTAAEPGNDIHPLAGQQVVIAKSDLTTLSPREVRLKIFRQVIEPYYYKGAQGVAESVTSEPAEQKRIQNQAGLLSLLNLKTHGLLLRALCISLIPLLLLLASVIFFSAGWGRLVSPALIMLVTTLVPNVLLALPLPQAGAGGHGISTFLSKDILSIMINATSNLYRGLIGLALVLLVAAIIGKLVSKRKTFKAPERDS